MKKGGKGESLLCGKCPMDLKSCTYIWFHCQMYVREKRCRGRGVGKPKRIKTMMASFTCLLPRLISSVLHKSQPPQTPQTASTNSLSALVLAVKAPHIKAADNSVSPIAVIATAPARIMTLCAHMPPKVSVSLCV